MVRRRNRRFRGRRRGVRRGRGLRRAFNGGLVRGRMHPPTSSASPWNMLVLTVLWQATAKGILCVGASQVRTHINKEIGLNDATKVDMRLFRMDIWTQPPESNTNRNCVVFSPCDWSTAKKCDSSSQINWYESWGTAVQPAHSHYIWPKSISNVVISSADEYTLFRLDCKDEKVALIFKFHLAWRPTTPDPYRLACGVMTSLRTHLQPPRPQEIDDDFTMVTDAAISPLAMGVQRVLSA